MRARCIQGGYGEAALHILYPVVIPSIYEGLSTDWEFLARAPLVRQ